MKKIDRITAIVEWDEETGLYVGTVPGIAGAHTQAATLDELRQNIIEVVTLRLQEQDIDPKDIPQFIGVQQIQLPA